MFGATVALLNRVTSGQTCRDLDDFNVPGAGLEPADHLRDSGF